MSKKLNTSVNKKKVILYFWGLFVVLPIFMFFVIMICAKTGSLGFDDLPSLQELENPKSNLASEIITTDGKLLGKYFKENRTNVKYEDLSPYLISALIATEDERFLNHSGIDFRPLTMMKKILNRSYHRYLKCMMLSF
jgi:penicillin-binding protein 1A